MAEFIALLFQGYRGCSLCQVEPSLIHWRAQQAPFEQHVVLRGIEVLVEGGARGAS